MKNLDFKKLFFNFCGAILIGFLITLIFSFIAQLKLINQLFLNQMVGGILQFSLLALIILILFKVYNEEIGKTTFKKISAKDFFEFNKKDLKMVLFLLVISIILGGIISSIIAMIAQDQESNVTITAIYVIGTITYTPFLEELVFRGMFYNLAYEWLDMKGVVNLTI